VQLRGPKRTIDLVVRDASEARALLHALELAPTSAKGAMPGTSPIASSPSTGGLATAAMLAGPIACGFAAVMSGGMEIASIVCVLSAAAAIALVVPSRIAIDETAIDVSWLWTRRTIPLSDVVRVERLRQAVRLHLEDGGEIDLGVHAPERLAERIEHALTERRAPP
jgi:hypothetical protein